MHGAKQSVPLSYLVWFALQRTLHSVIFLCLDILSLDEDESISTSTTEDFIIKDQNSEITCGFDCLKQGNKGRHDPGAAAASLPVAAAASQDFF